jgi:twitching motility protein PilT
MSSKPIYEIPVTGDDANASLGFPPPPPQAMPVSYSPAPPSVSSAPAPSGAPAFPPPSAGSTSPASFPPPPPMSQVPTSPSVASFPPPAPTSAPVAPPAAAAPLAPPIADAPAAPDQAAPTFAAPAPATPAFAAPAPTLEAPLPESEPTPGFTFDATASTPGLYEVPAAPQAPLAWEEPAATAVFEIPSVPTAGGFDDELLNFPPPRAAEPSKHSELFTPSALPVQEVDFGEEAGYADADPDLTTALRDVLLMNASDLHVSANMPPMVRVDGGLRPATFTEAWSADKVRTALRSIMTDAQKETFDEHLELDFAYTVSSNARFRVNFYQQREAMGAAFRLIPTEIKQLSDLGIPDTIARFATLARGLVLVTGPTGSGKSTTLAALVDLVNRTRADHIMTVEDPIEFLHGNHKSLVNQREVGNDTHSFGAALKHVLRQDPDVILIGELRDLETISVALTAAETGHLVFATLHTQDAAQTIDRIIDVFPPHQQGQVRSQLAATLQGVVCQTLVKKASGKGRVVATEVLIATPAVANLIREGKTFQIASAMQAGGDLGMHTMDRHLADLCNSGVITQRAALDKAQDVEGIKQLIHRIETPSDVASRAMDASSIDFHDAYSGTAN